MRFKIISYNAARIASLTRSLIGGFLQSRASETRIYSGGSAPRENLQRLNLGMYEADLNIPLKLLSEYGRNHKLVGFNDRLYAKAVSLRYAGTRVLLVSVDIVAITNEVSDEIRAEVEKKYGIPRSNIVVLATHTHSCPDTLIWPVDYYGYGEKPDEDFFEFIRLLKQNTLYAIGQSMKHEDEVLSVFHSSTECHGLFTNRDEPTRPIDNSVTSIYFKTGSKSLLLVNHNAHPTVIGLNNTGYSADFPATLSRRIGEQLGLDQVNCITGSSADVSPRQTLGDNDSPNRTVASSRKYGTIMADSVIRSLSASKSIVDFELSARSEKVAFEIKTHPDRNEAEKIKASLEEEGRKSKSVIDKIRIDPAIRGINAWMRALEINQGKFPKTIDGEIGAFYIGQDKFTLVWAPGEIFSYTGLKVKGKSKSELTMISGYGNGYNGYFPNADAYSNLEYEANVTPVAVSAHETLEASMLRLVG
jgi:neutral ceramidase